MEHISKTLYNTIARCHAVIMRNNGDVKLLDEIDRWLDDQIENIGSENEKEIDLLKFE